MPIKNLHLVIPVVLLGALLAHAAQTSDQKSAPPDVLTKEQARALEATANTPQDHLKLAAYHREQARKFEQKVVYHLEMGEMYREHPLPFDGKMAVPMQRHCKEWASRFAEEEERERVLANFHGAQASGSGAVAQTFNQPARFGLLSTGFNADGIEVAIQATPEQASSFRTWRGTSGHFYDLTRIGTYLLSAKGRPPVEIEQLQNSAVAVFDAQRHFLQSLTEPQRAVLASQLHAIDKGHQEIEKHLNLLTTGRTSSASRAYLTALKSVKKDLEKSNCEQQEIALRLGIDSAATRNRSSWQPHWGVPAFGWRPKNR